MVDFETLENRIYEVKRLLDLQEDEISIDLIPKEYCDIEPFCKYKAVYQKDTNSIFIHPNALAMDSLTDVTASISHELFHAFQYKTNPELFDTQITQNYDKVGIEYVKQPLEMQAYAFQIAIIMMYDECNCRFELDGLDKETINKINILAEQYYQQYVDKFCEIVSE